MSFMKTLIRPVSLLLAFATVASQPFAVAVMAAPAPAPMPLPFFMPDDGDGNNEEGEDLIATQQAVFEQLFKTPWSQEAWTYPLDQKVEGEGFYEGANQYSQPFGLEVKVAAKVELETVGLPDDQYEFAKTRGFEYYGVIGTLKTELATVTVTGVAFSQGSDIAASESYFMLVNTVDAENALFNPTPAAGVQDAEVEPQWFPLLLPKFCPDHECEAACTEDNQACVDAAQAAYDMRTQRAQGSFDNDEARARTIRDDLIAPAGPECDAQIASANRLLIAAMLVATAALIKVHAGCVATLFFALVCVAAGYAAYAIAVAIALTAYEAAVRSAESSRDGTIAQAQALYETTVMALRGNLQNALDNATADLGQDLRACEAALRDCLRDCEPVVCGWFIIWIRTR